RRHLRHWRRAIRSESTAPALLEAGEAMEDARADGDGGGVGAFGLVSARPRTRTDRTRSTSRAAAAAESRVVGRSRESDLSPPQDRRRAYARARRSLAALARMVREAARSSRTTRADVGRQLAICGRRRREQPDLNRGRRTASASP